jgi:type I restriction enzyme S subunit
MLPLCPLIVPRYIHYAIAEPSKNAELFDLAREVTRKTLNLGLLKDALLPIPPLVEQNEIVRRVEALFRLADAIEKCVASATARTEGLTQANLAKAFRGELVPTEAELAPREGREYEAALLLLERIKVKQEKAEAAPRARVRSMKA